jgi:hypothetical protein
MTPLSQSLIELAKTSLTDPRQAARQLMALDLSRDTLWSAALLVSILSALVTHASLLGGGPIPAVLAFATSPFMLTVFMAANLVIVIFSLFWTGRALGGQGTLPGFIALMTWLQVMMVLFELAQMLVGLLLGPVSALLGLVAMGWWVWATVIFTTEGHRFEHWARALTTIALALAGVVAGLSIFLSLIGAGVLGIPVNV